MKQSKPRKIEYDLIRCVCILLVIYGHTNEHGYFLYALPCSWPLKIFYIIAAELIAAAVPPFFMISGALLLGRTEDYKTVLRKRVLRFVLVLVIFSGIQYSYKLAVGRASLGAVYFMQLLFDKGTIAPYWFLYAYLAYLISLPLLRKLAQSMSRQDFRYLFAAYLILEACLPTILYFFGITELNSFFVIPVFDRVVIYPFLGYYMECVVPEEEMYNPGHTRMAWGALTATFVFFILMTLYRDLPYEEFTTYDKGLYVCGFNVVLNFAVFYLLRRFASTRSFGGFSTRLISTVGVCSFGMYLLEQPVRESTESLCGLLSPHIGVWPACVVWVLLVAAIVFVITLVLKRIPGLKKLL